jgi:hypothetical protein
MPAQVLFGGPYVTPPPLLGGSNRHGPSGSNPVGGTSHSVTSGFQIPIGVQPQVGGGNLNLGDNLILGDNLNLGGNLKLETLTHFMDKIYLCYNINLGIFLSKVINNCLGGSILKSILPPQISVNRTQVL